MSGVALSETNSLGSQIDSGKHNNLNIIRLLLALLVIFSHSFPLTLGVIGAAHVDPDLFNLWSNDQSSLGGVAVSSFFFISGFLITASWQRSKSLFDYFLKRILRIYPGFIVAMGFSAALIWTVCPEFGRLTAHPEQWFGRFCQDLLLLDTSSISGKGIFAANPSPGSVNGSLWTISIEFTCYICVLVFGVVGLFKRRWLVLAVGLIAYGWYVIDLFHGTNRYDQFSNCFAVGAVAWLWRDKIPFKTSLAGLALVLLVVSSHFKPWFLVTLPLAGGYCLLWLAYGPRLMFSSWAEKTDLSYGTYLYAFPIQQVLAMSVALRNPWLMFLLAAPVTLFMATLSWHFVERPCLSLKTRSAKAFPGRTPGAAVPATASS